MNPAAWAANPPMRNQCSARQAALRYGCDILSTGCLFGSLNARWRLRLKSMSTEAPFIIVLAALGAALLVRFRIRITRQYDRWRCEVRYGRVALIDTNRGKGHQRKAVKPESKTKRRKGLSVSRFMEIAPSLMRAAGRGLRFLLRRTRLDRLRI